MPRSVVLFAIFTAGHFVAAVSAFAWTFSVSSKAFDGKPSGVISAHLAGPLADILWFPILPILETTASYGFKLSPMLNGCCWSATARSGALQQA
jgi:hypothetical protein